MLDFNNESKHYTSSGLPFNHIANVTSSTQLDDELEKVRYISSFAQQQEATNAALAHLFKDRLSNKPILQSLEDNVRCSAAVLQKLKSNRTSASHSSSSSSSNSSSSSHSTINEKEITTENEAETDCASGSGHGGVKLKTLKRHLTAVSTLVFN